jgi:cyclic beta-1,2-glucan synthetase
MPQNTHVEFAGAEAELPPESAKALASQMDALRSHGSGLAAGLVWLPSKPTSRILLDRHHVLYRALEPLLRALEAPLPNPNVSDDFRWAHDNVRLLHADLEETGEAFRRLRKTPHVRTRDGAVVPRALAVAEGLLAATEYRFSASGLTSYVEGFQESTILQLKELWLLSMVLKLALLERIASRSSQLLAQPSASFGVGACVRSLRDVGQTSWKNVLEPLISFDHVLRQDPAGAFARMDFESRDLYRTKLAKIAEHSDGGEMDVAAAAVALAREAQRHPDSNPRVTLRRSHVGYYLLQEGAALLYQKVGYRPPFGERIQLFLLEHPDEFYLPAIEVIGSIVVLAVILPLVGSDTSLGLILLSTLLLLLPASQAAVLLVNYLTTSLLPAQLLPKLDFSEGIPSDCTSMVAIPSLLLNEKQIRRLVDDLEVRFLGNHDPNLYFALLTDLPDSPELALEDDPRVLICAELIRELNEQYAGQGAPFLLLHRHRVYNPRERQWMGFERKRGKLLDLNKLLRHEFDSFPVKVGDLSILPRIRFVITLDSDTELPRGSAHRMIGALAHPLNQAIIDQEKNIVVAGYGILQPRVGVSVQSAAVSRLASIYSGETGFDIYTRAVSDVYQDLYGEGIFAGKGIYEVETLHRVLDRRFPRNILLSHDLIEGAYARAGLVSDIEVIEDYPSHYSAYNRRKHRWLRGDWQIAGWLNSRVPDESGSHVENPISLVSKWKILDNLRRSLVEPAIFLLLVLGWFALPRSAAYWTVATIAILFAPAWCRFAFELVRAAIQRKEVIARDALDALVTANASVFLTLTFLAHQTMLSLDAVFRTLVRRLVTQRGLLQWETAAEAELGTAGHTPLDVYLRWMPALALGLGLLLFSARPAALPAALPILLLWGSSRLVSLWLNRPPHGSEDQVSHKDRLLLRRAALRTWRYFAEFSTVKHHWLIPDNVQEEPPAIASRISPTNLGFLLNARQVACEFGYLTIPEFAEQTSRTLATASELPRYRGHYFNWYDTQTLAPLPPAFISSVDSGNLLASLWTLQQGSLHQLTKTLLPPSLADGFLDYLRALVELRAFSRGKFSNLQRELKRKSGLSFLLDLPDNLFAEAQRRTSAAKESSAARWFLAEAQARLENLRQTVRTYAPWLLPEFTSLLRDTGLKEESFHPEFAAGAPALKNMPGFVDMLAGRLRAAMDANESAEHAAARERLLTLLPEARTNALRLIESLHAIAAEAGRLANEMDFRFLLNQQRNLLSVGYDVEAERLHPACYDLLATESRTAIFTAIAKEDIPQESWFRLGRGHTLYHGRPVLLSWSGTMFEYLMPSLWMRSYPNTLMERSRLAAVRSQQAYTASKNIPWGISESAYFKMDEAGNYQYHAFGIPYLALREREHDSLVISPYSSVLALSADPAAAFQNLRKMAHFGWFGAYGFYEAADFTPSRRRSRFRRYELVRCWMTHHQGMSLLSIANFLHNGIVQTWFHADPRVQATELLLHEKPVSHVRPARAGYETAAG